MMNARHGLALVVLTTTIVSIVHVVIASDKTTDDLYDDTSPCKWGSAGDCGVNQKCPDGSTCEKAWKSSSDGFCCWDKPRNKTGNSSGAKAKTEKTSSEIKSTKAKTEIKTAATGGQANIETSVTKRPKEAKSVNKKSPIKVDYPYPRYKGVKATKKPSTTSRLHDSRDLKRPVADENSSNIRGEKQLHSKQELTLIKKLFANQELTHTIKQSPDSRSPVYSDFSIPSKPYADIRRPKYPDTKVDNGPSQGTGSPPKTDSTQYNDNRRDQLDMTYPQTFPQGFCPNGHEGECSSLFGPICRNGTTCKLIGKFPGAPGRCCVDKAGEERCPSGIVGSKCLRPLDCQHGYTCRNGFCCRDAVCPKDWENGGQCNLLSGQQKCKEGYDCINDVCCRPTFCPSGLIGPTCSKLNPCKPGYSCKSNYCCRDPVCPKNWTEGGSCNFTPEQPKCRDGYQCIDGFCCRVPVIFCPSGVIGKICSKHATCEPGYTCRFGFCCQDSLCPKDWENGGQCNLSPGQQKCKEGFDCINDVCCRPKFCPSGLIGPTCSKLNPCKPGYSCKSNYCCRDPVCPSNWTEGGSCNFTPGQPKCRDGYQCIDGFCCRVPAVFCPSGVIGKICSKHAPCEPGYTCRFGFCCRDSVCPKDWENGGQCNLLPGQQKCKEGYDCINDLCCRPTFCSLNLIGPACSKQHPCKPGYSCKSNYCCRDPVCPSNWTEGGSCNFIPGQPKCREGYQCIDGFCCRAPAVFCPSGDIGKICSNDKQCDPGYTCRSGVCCRESVCPKDWENGGQCNLSPGQQKCKEGFDCINDVCCRPTFCPSGLIGPPCSKLNPCKPGYSCKSNYCCRDPVCPENWTEGGSCNFTPGQPKCREGYQCIDGFCCRVPEVFCPSGVIGRVCSKHATCEPGYTCSFGFCCQDSVCPKNWIKGEMCNFLPGQPKCKEGYECINNTCCRSTFCPSGSIGSICFANKTCEPGYKCINNYCCKQPFCPDGWLEGGVCNLTPGQELCEPGFECNNDFCCKRPDSVCPDGTFGKGYCNKEQGKQRCGAGFQCIKGICCRTAQELPVCKQPKETGVCRAYIPRWFYNYETKECEQFIYGGCGGNKNNFERKEDCEKECAPKIPVCKQPKRVGPCRAAMPRWFYNSDTKSCESFIYGGCGGNDNNFERKEDCEQRCGVKTLPIPVCKQPKVTGPCRGAFPRWFFNYETNICEQFIYGGCHGNDNNFEKIEDCLRACVEPKIPTLPVCLQPKESGPCLASIPRWFFNLKSKSCEQFIYGGCQGNENNFKRKEDCEKKCSLIITPPVPVCNQPKEVGPCKGAFPRWFYNSETKSCEQFIYGGCQGNENNFERREDCENKCGAKTVLPVPVCKQPKKTGPCKGAFPRWFYNSETKSCEQFIYGGCHGNENNFERREDCENKCGAKTVPHVPICKQPKKAGPCKGAFPRWFYNSDTNSCEQFIYGGCQGNENNFERREDCENKCGAETAPPVPVCKQPKITGPCKGAFPRWFYNSETKSCEQFIYGGCHGNGNNFERREDCENKCGAKTVLCPFGQDGICGGILAERCKPGTVCVDDGGPVFPDKAGVCCIIGALNETCQYGQDGVCGGVLGLTCKQGTTCTFKKNYPDGMGKCCKEKTSTEAPSPVCKQPKKVGPCNAVIPRWFYNSETKKCERFIYGGCQGNDNNFHRREDCERLCSAVTDPQLPVCKQPKKIGPCDGVYPRWFYNYKAKTCEPFIFGGCEPNDNNFITRDDCKRQCEYDTCQYGQDGVCGGILSLVCKRGTTCKFRENYPDALGKCCVEKPSTEPILPVCKQPKKVGPCEAAIPRWFYNVKTKTCERFIYGGCQGNDNNFQRREDCERLCSSVTDPKLPVCKQPKKIGPCDGVYPRWYFNYKAKVCEPFIFGGCEPNDNNFFTRKDCEERCGVDNGGKQIDKETCLFGQDGICGGVAGLQCRPGTTCMFKGSFPDAAGKCCIVKHESKTCQYGQDGMCGGILGLVCKPGTTCRYKANNPTAFGKCCLEKTSTDPKLPVCKQPKKIGPCDGVFPRWFYNYKAKVCEPFDFGGCEPNDNNFKTKEDCERRCGVENGKPIGKETCRFGQDGICGGIAGLQCRPGTMCMFQGSFPDAAGKCCIVKPESRKPIGKETCRFGQDGICGGIAGLQCRPGTMCMFQGSFPDAAGKCCIVKPESTDKPIDKETCRFGQDGICGGIAGLQCRPGTMCMFKGSFPDAAGKCCIVKTETRKPIGKEICRFGQDGICGGIAGFQCRPGTMCMFQGSFPDAAGKCCIVKPESRDPIGKETCQFGQDGVCGGIAGLQCRPGTMCMFQGSFPDSTGKCCIVKPESNPQLPVCKQPMKIGPCDGLFPRWFYNYKTKVCEPFDFGGCEPNDNNFKTKEDCERRCGVENGGNPNEREKCRFGQDGICGGIAGLQCRPGTMCMFKGSFPDAAGKCCVVNFGTKTCQYGQDGVCGGILGLVCKPGTTCRFKENNPTAFGKCCIEKNITDPQLPVCKQPKKIGPCDGVYPRWYYNFRTKVCESFIFGGCEPNDNNFKTKEDCERRCGVENDICPFGQDGTCGGVFALTCRPGTSCFFKGNYPDAVGKCCITKQTAGRCPPPDSQCSYTPSRSCTRDECEKQGLLCCQDKCGSACKTPVHY